MNTISLQYHLDGIPKILRLKMIKCILITTNTILEILRVWKMTSNTQWAKIKLLAITLRIIAITITIMAKKLIDYCNNQ